MRWITRTRPKIDRIACPWLIRRFIDRDAEFFFVPTDQVMIEADRLDATPFDVEGVELSHDGPLCSFDSILRKYGLTDPFLHEIAVIVRGADTEHLELAPQAAGLLAISLGLSRIYDDDQAQLAQGMIIYDALYAWAREAKQERHTWNPQRTPSTAGV
jgi:hypothetical protein